MQLVDERTTLLDTMRDRRIGVDRGAGALRGRARRWCPTCSGSWATRSTTSPACTGIGEKTASALVAALGPVEAILAAPRRGRDGAASAARRSVRETLAREADTARLSKTLATIRRDVPVTLDLEALRWPGAGPRALRAAASTSSSSSRCCASSAPTRRRAAGRAHGRDHGRGGGRPSRRRWRGAGARSPLVPDLDSPRATGARARRRWRSRRRAGRWPWCADAGGGRTCSRRWRRCSRDLAVDEDRRRREGAARRARAPRRRARRARPSICRARVLLPQSVACRPRPRRRWPRSCSGMPRERRRPTRRRSRAAARARARAACRCSPTRLRAHDMERLFRELEMPLADVLAEMELAGITLDVRGARAAARAELGASLERLMARDPRARRRRRSTSTRRPSCARCCSSGSSCRPAACGAARPGCRPTSTCSRGSRASIRCRRRSSSTARSRSSSRPTSTRCRRSSIRAPAALHTSFNQTVAATGRLVELGPEPAEHPDPHRGGPPHPRGLRRRARASPDLRRLLADRAARARAPRRATRR